MSPLGVIKNILENEEKFELKETRVKIASDILQCMLRPEEIRKGIKIKKEIQEGRKRTEVIFKETMEWINKMDPEKKDKDKKRTRSKEEKSEIKITEIWKEFNEVRKILKNKDYSSVEKRLYDIYQKIEEDNIIPGKEKMEMKKELMSCIDKTGLGKTMKGVRKLIKAVQNLPKEDGEELRLAS